MSLIIMTLGTTKITTPCIMALRIETVSLMALRIMALRTMGIMTFKIMTISTQ